MACAEVFVGGSGSFAAEISDWVRASELHVAGLVELLNDDRVGEVRHGVPVVGLEPPLAGACVVVGAEGDRRQTWARLEARGWLPRTVVHPTASLAGDVPPGTLVQGVPARQSAPGSG